MKIRTLSCFQDFQCIAERCEHSCCVGWEIDVDEESFERYQCVPGPFGEELRRSIVTEADGTRHYALTQGERCPFLRPDGLCRQILELGEGSLCEICANHPRFFRRFGDIEEQGVGIACEEAARLLFTHPEPLSLREQGSGEGPRGEEALYAFLTQWRDACLEAASDGALSIHERLAAVLDLGCQAEALLLGEEWSGAPAEVLPGHALLWLERLEELESVDEEWSCALEDALAAAQYPELLEEFALGSDERQYDRLLIYLLYRHALCALWDADPRRWGDFAVFGVLTVELLDFGRWLRRGQRFDLRDRLDMARIFSKEIEYDPELMEGLGELFREFPPFVST